MKLSKSRGMHISDFDSEAKTVAFEVTEPDTKETYIDKYHYEDEKLEPYFEKAMLSTELTMDIVYEPSGANRIGEDAGKIIRAYLRDWNGEVRQL